MWSANLARSEDFHVNEKSPKWCFQSWSSGELVREKRQTHNAGCPRRSREDTDPDIRPTNPKSKNINALIAAPYLRPKRQKNLLLHSAEPKAGIACNTDPVPHIKPGVPSSDSLRCSRVARIDDVVEVVAHGNEQVEEQLPASLAVHVAAAFFHLGLHGAAPLEGLAAPDDER